MSVQGPQFGAIGGTSGAPTAHASSHEAGGTDALPSLPTTAEKAALGNATALPTPSTLMLRDGAGRAQVATPSASQDVATKGYVDTTPRSTLLNTSGAPYNYAANSTWSTAAKTTIATFAFTSSSTGKVRLVFAGNLSGTNGAWGDLSCNVVGVAGSEKGASVHFHTQGPRNDFQVEYTHTLAANTLYTCTLYITPGSGSITCNAVSSPITNWLQASAREGA